MGTIQNKREYIFAVFLKAETMCCMVNTFYGNFDRKTKD